MKKAMQNMVGVKTCTPTTHPHIALFPFMSKGHTIPLLQLAKLINKHRPHATFTIFTTLANEPFISTSLSSLSSEVFTVVSFPFPVADGIPSGVESTDQLPSISLFYTFALATDQIQPHFETALQNLQTSNNPISFLISDFFLYWTHQSASKFNIPRLVFSGMNVYAGTLSRVVSENGLFKGHASVDELLQVPEFPWIRVRKQEFLPILFDGNETQGPRFDFTMNCATSSSMSQGVVVNSFYELERHFVDFSNSKWLQKSWCVGPFCLLNTKPTLESLEKPAFIKWLDAKSTQGKRVLYVAFGSQAEISGEQVKEMAKGLEESGVNFLWALRVKPNQEEVLEGFEERVKDRGLVVRGWVDQRAIVEHESVQGFLSHCGWNSVIESICAGVPVLAWPMMAEQHLNALMVVEEIKVGLRVETCEGQVKWEGLSKMVRELMEGEMGKIVRKKVTEVSLIAKKATEEGGSSWHNLEMLLSDLDPDGVAQS